MLTMITLLLAMADETGFRPLFDGKSLKGWQLVGGHGQGYLVEDGSIVCPADGGGNLLTDREYGDFILRLEYKLSPGGNNGVGIRTPLTGDAAYVGMEIQVLDDQHAMYKGKIKPEQHTASIYDVFPARTGFQKPAGEWNEEEIHVEGRRVKITLNGVVTIDANLDNVKEAAVLKKHPGLLRTSGYLGFLGHNTRVEYRNIRLRELVTR
ncbi:MAG: DUF1080 domain-containing protein [Bryobacteraceae bacterium]|nr:DUF1080 domain-containing protein [Bryobacteraceae bacterium]